MSQSRLVRGSLFVFIANNTANFGNFLYSLFMGRMLTPHAFGDLGATLSILAIFSIPLSVFQLLMVKTISFYWGGRKTGVVKLLLHDLTPRLFLLGIFLTAITILFAGKLSIFLQLENALPLIIISLIFVLSFSATLNRATLQGTLSFSYLSANSIVEVILKLIVSILLVILNFGLVGAMMGTLIGAVGGYLLTVLELRILFSKYASEENVKAPKWLNWKTALPVLLTSLTITLFFTSDIILVKHFFAPDVAGEYVALSTVGKIIYYLIGPIISVMFPLVSGRAGNGTPYIMPLLGTLVFALGISSLLIFTYFLFPGLILSILYGGRYAGAIPYMGIFSFFITLLSVNSILTYFLLSISSGKPIYFLFLISLLQSVFIFFIHNSIREIIWINIFVSLLYFTAASFFVWQKEKKVLTHILLKNIHRNMI